MLILPGPLLLRCFPLSDGRVVSLVAFFLPQTLAGRYTYSNVPCDAWARPLTGHDVAATFGFIRNDFDRCISASACCGSHRLRRPFSAMPGLSRRAGVLMAFLFIGAFSAAYEIFEWQLTLLAPTIYYNNEQGDPWGSRKDMAMAIPGGGVASLWALRKRHA